MMKSVRTHSRLILWLKSTGLTGAIIGLLVFPGLPIVGWALQRAMEENTAAALTQAIVLLLIPLLSPIGPVQVLTTYLSPPSVEVFAASPPKNRLSDAVKMQLVYLLLSLMALLPLSFMGLIGIDTMVRVGSVSLFLFGLVYFLMASTKNMTISVLVSILYVVGSLIGGGGSGIPAPFYITAGEGLWPDFAVVYAAYAGVGILGVALGEWIIRKRGVL